MSSKSKRGTLLSNHGVFNKISLILRPESSFYLSSIIYGVGVSILTLAIPISVQSLVNTVSFGVLLQPLVVISIVLFGLLIFSGLLNALQSYVIEMFQRHFYARVTSGISIKVLNSKPSELGEKNAVELMNRYFDVMTVQKSVTTLLTGGIAIVLQTLVGMILLAFYHPYFLVFDIILGILIAFVWSFFGRDALETAKVESKSKYKVAGWLEELARLNLFFKTEKRKSKALKVTDQCIGDYLNARRKHFNIVFAQDILSLSIYAILSAVVLGLGGFLVISGELTLGQLVAAELVVTIMLSNFSKAAKYLESFYDLYAAVDKISAFYELSPEGDGQVEQGGEALTHGFSLDVSAETDIGRGETLKLDYHFKEKSRTFICPDNGANKLTLLNYLRKLSYPKTGKLEFGGLNFEGISPLYLREAIHIVDHPCVFEGSIFDNLTFGQEGISHAVVMKALRVVGLDQIIDDFDDGLNTCLIPSGRPFWSSQLVRLEIAKAVLAKPKIIVMTDIFDQLELAKRNSILDYFFKEDVTLLLFSNRECREHQFDNYLYLGDYQFTQCDDYQSLNNMVEKC